MSMIGHLRQITPAELERLRAHPSEVLGFLGEGVTPGQMIGVDEAQALIGKFQDVAARILSDPAMRGNPAAAQAKAREEMMRLMGRAPSQATTPPSPSASPGADSGELNLDKAWHGIHFLLTGRIDEAPPPLGNAILGGTEIGEDLGYGPARYLTPEQVREVAQALAAITREEFARRLDPQRIRQAGVYALEGETTAEYCVEYFEKVVAYYRDAASKGNAMLLYLD
jgi:hypothetical protein